MRILIVFCGFIALTCAEIAASNKYSVLHHSEHEQSVSKAKQSLQERLALLEGQQGSYNLNQAQYGNAYGSSGSEKYVTGCSSCIGGSESYSSRLSSSSQRGSSTGYGVSGSDYEGVGIVGHTADDDDSQTIVSPYVGSATASRYSSSKAFEAEDLQQKVVPADLSSVSSNAYRSSLSEHDEDDLQRTVGSGYGGSSRIYQRTGTAASESSRVGSAAVPVYVLGGSQRSHSSQSEADSNRNYVSFSARPGQSTVLAVPVRVLNVQGVPDESGNYYSRTAEQRASEQASSSTRVQSPTSTTYRVTYNPTRNYVASDRLASSTSEHENSRSSVQLPEKFVGYNSFNVPESSSQTRFRAEESDSHASQSQVRVAPVSVSYPSNGGSSRFASTGSSSAYNQARVVPVFPVNTIESTSSLRTAEEKEQRRYTPASPTYISASRLSAAEQEERNQQASSQFGSSGTYYTPVTTQTRVHAGSGSQSQHQSYGGSYTPYVATGSQLSNSGSSSDRLSTQRFGLGSASTDDVHVYMSESERLARLQQQQIAGSSSNVAATSNYDANRRTLHTASNLDSAAANFVRSSNVANRNSEFDTASVDGSANGAGGYNRVRSWNKQSKWSSGSEYGPDGKPKTYSTLSTGEAEKYNINGAETGYKAATTTLENDGKVSTYSIHTP